MMLVGKAVISIEPGGVPVPVFPVDNSSGSALLDAGMWTCVGIAIIAAVYFAGYRAYVEWPWRKERTLPDWSAYLWIVAGVLMLAGLLGAWGFDTLRTDQRRAQSLEHHSEITQFYDQLWADVEDVYGVSIMELSSWIVEDPDGDVDSVTVRFPDGHEEDCELARASRADGDVLTLTCPTTLPVP